MMGTMTLSLAGQVRRSLPAGRSDNSVLVPYGVEDTPMHIITPPKTNKHTLKLPPLDPTKVWRGYRPHRGGAGSHGDRRMKRQRTRGDQWRVAVADY